MKSTEKLGLHLFEGTDPVSVKKINENTETLEQAVSGRAQISVGSYVGNGDSTRSLTFDFEPSVLMILQRGVETWPFKMASRKEYPDTYVDRADRGITFIKGCTTYPTYGHYSNGSPTYFVDTHITVSFDGNSVSWSLPEEETFNGGEGQVTAPLVSGEGLFNWNGHTYHYLAIG
jgi:hypothetical protein